LIKVKRVYEKPDKDDGFRILVDRIWPRGLSRTRAKVDLWLKEIAPSNELRRWFSHDPEKWDDFKKKYGMELEKKGELIVKLKQIQNEKGIISLLFGARDEKHNNAVALSDYLQRR
jgi:uncharacterized protein YeaO (DUF488 family)